MRTSRLPPNRARLLGAIALVAATAGCSRGELSAAEREQTKQEMVSSDAPAKVSPTSIRSDSSGLIDVVPPESQTKASSSIEDILKSSPLKNPKADCATPVTGASKPVELRTQCPTDPPVKK